MSFFQEYDPTSVELRCTVLIPEIVALHGMCLTVTYKPLAVDKLIQSNVIHLTFLYE